MNCDACFDTHNVCRVSSVEFNGDGCTLTNSVSPLNRTDRAGRPAADRVPSSTAEDQGLVPQGVPVRRQRQVRQLPVQ